MLGSIDLLCWSTFNINGVWCRPLGQFTLDCPLNFKTNKIIKMCVTPLFYVNYINSLLLLRSTANYVSPVTSHQVVGVVEFHWYFRVSTHELLISDKQVEHGYKRKTRDDWSFKTQWKKLRDIHLFISLWNYCTRSCLEYHVISSNYVITWYVT
jgi:hypothetical protein